MRNAVLSGGNGLGGAAAGMPELVPVCGGGGCQWRGGFFFCLGGGGGGGWGGRAPAPPGGGPAPSRDPSRLPARGEAAGSKRKTSAGENRWPGWHAAPVRSV